MNGAAVCSLLHKLLNSIAR